jgi:hypothetical protein
MTTVRIGFEVLVYANVRRNPEMQGGLVRFGRSYALVKQVTREGPLEVWVRMVRPSEAISSTSIPWSGQP